MNKILIDIAKRLTCKAIKVNTEEYKVQVSYKFICSAGAIDVTLFDENKCSSFMLYDDEIYSDIHHINQFRKILRKIRKKEL